MHVAVLGINHRTASVEIREQVALSEGCYSTLIHNLVARPGIDEAVTLSTCNRTELYAAGPDLPMRDSLVAGLSEVTRLTPSHLEPILYYWEDREAVTHLFTVASSLDSMVLGEAEILHQLKCAYHVAEDTGGPGLVLNKLLRRSFRVGKRVRTETKIGESPVSAASVSVDLIQNVLGDLTGKTALLIGAGEMAQLVATHLRGRAVGRILVANRTPQRAVELAQALGGEAVEYERLDESLRQADIVVSSTASRAPIIRRENVEATMRTRDGRLLLMIDMAVPRDVEAAVGDLEGVHLYDIDDLQQVTASNLEERRREAVKACDIIEEEVGHFQGWMSSLSVVPTVVALREWAASVRKKEVERFLARTPDLSEEERHKVELLASSLVNKLLHPPTAELKRLPASDAERHAESLRLLFDLNEEDSTSGPETGNGGGRPK